MTPIIIQFNLTGPSDIDVQAVCENWQDGYSITFVDDDYILNIRNSRIRKTSVVIAEAKAKEIIKNLSLIKVASMMLKNCYDYYTKKYVETEIENLSALINNCTGYDDIEITELRNLFIVALENHSFANSLNHN